MYFKYILVYFRDADRYRGNAPHGIAFKDICFTRSFVIIVRDFLKYVLLPNMSKTVIFHKINQ